MHQECERPSFAEKRVLQGTTCFHNFKGFYREEGQDFTISGTRFIHIHTSHRGQALVIGASIFRVNTDEMKAMYAGQDDQHMDGFVIYKK